MLIKIFVGLSVSTDVTRQRIEDTSMVTTSDNIRCSTSVITTNKMGSSSEFLSSSSTTECVTERSTEDANPSTDSSYDDDMPDSTSDNSEETNDDFVSQICENLPLDEFLAPHPSDCTKFLFCDHGRVIISSCSAGLWYDSIQRECVYPRQGDCVF